jgi:hypothetical protein
VYQSHPYTQPQNCFVCNHKKFTGVQKLQEAEHVVSIRFCSCSCETVCSGEVNTLLLILHLHEIKFGIVSIMVIKTTHILKEKDYLK